MARVPRAGPWLLLVLVTLGGEPVIANPYGAQVVQGQAQLVRPDASTLNVHSSRNAIIHWQGFSIGPHETTRFVQPSADSAVLNRVVGPDPSQILGQLLSNGRVYLINPNGIVFGPTATVDTAGLIASTLNITDQDFLAGRLRFEGDRGRILNQGIVRAGAGGNVILIAPDIENGGVVAVRDGGHIVLAAGRRLTITSWDDPHLQFEVQAPTDSVVNLGKVLTDGGAARLFAGTLRHSGEVRADGLRVGADGAIELVASMDARLERGSVTAADGPAGGAITVQSGHATAVAGRITATGVEDRGGAIRVLGRDVGLADTAEIDASGPRGGGEVLIGGPFQGQGDLPRASTTRVASGARIRADATGRGDGGRVVVFADDRTEFFGQLSVRGGTAGGDGGLAEVSAKGFLHYAGYVDAAAPQGRPGRLLLDPDSACVVTQSSTCLSDPTLTTFSLIDLNGNANSTSVTANADILVMAAHDLEFQDTIVVQNAITLIGRAGNDVRVLPGAEITAPKGSVLLSANDPASGGVPSGAGSVVVAGPVRVGTVQTGHVALRAGGAGAIIIDSTTVEADADNGGSITLTPGPAGTIEFRGTTGTPTLLAADLLFQTNALSLSGSATLRGTNRVRIEPLSPDTTIRLTDAPVAPGELGLPAALLVGIDAPNRLEVGRPADGTGTLFVEYPISSSGLNGRLLMLGHGSIVIDGAIDFTAEGEQLELITPAALDNAIDIRADIALAAGATLVTGLTPIRFVSGNAVTVGAALDATAVEVAGAAGITTLNGPVSVQTLTVRDGVLQINAAASVDRFSFSGGSVAGAGSLAIREWLAKSGPGTALFDFPLSTVGADGSTVAITLTEGILQLGAGGDYAGGTRFEVANAAALELTGGVHRLVDGVTFAGSGVYRVFGATLDIAGTPGLRVETDATLALSEATLTGSGRLDNAGTLISTGASRVTGSLANLGVLEVQDGVLQVDGGLVQWDPDLTDGRTPRLALVGGDLAATLTLGSAAADGLANGGMLMGDGTIVGDLLNLAGTVAPGGSAGRITVTGDYQQGAAAVLAMEIGGREPGITYDQLAVLGDAALDGTLSVALIDAFAPTGDDTFELVSVGGTLSGAFARTLLPTGLEAADEVTTDVVLRVAATGTDVPGTDVPGTDVPGTDIPGTDVPGAGEAEPGVPPARLATTEAAATADVLSTLDLLPWLDPSLAMTSDAGPDSDEEDEKKRRKTPVCE